MSGTDRDGAPKASRAGLRWALRLLGLGLLVLVMTQVNWRDSVVLPDGTAVPGEIVGDVPREVSAGSRVTLRLPDGSERAFALADLRQEVLSGESFPEVNEGILRIVRRSDRGLLLLGLLLYGVIVQSSVWRWLILLRAQGIRVSFWTAHKLTFIGMFFNNVVPGPTGGDVVKAVYVARGARRRTPAVVTVLVDRILGIVALALIALSVLVTRLDEPAYREMSWFVFGLLGLLVLAGSVFFSRRIRALLRLDAVLDRLPGAGLLRKVNDAVFQWRHHKMTLVWALLLSFANQMGIQVMMWIFAAGLHMTTRTGGDVPIADFMVVLPVAFIGSALPVLPGSWGLRETLFAVCFHFVGVDRNPAVALSVMNGMVGVAWSLLGGVYFLVGRAAGEFEKAPQVAEDAED